MTGSLKTRLLFNYVKVFLQVAYPIVTFPYISRILGANALGQMNFARSAVQFGAVVAALGLINYGTNAIARVAGNADERYRVSSELLSFGLLSSLLVTVTLAVTFAIAGPFQDVFPILMIFLPMIVANAIGMEWYFQGTQDFKGIAIRQVVFQILSLVALFCFVHSRQDLVAYCVISAGSFVFPMIWNLARYVNEFKKPPHFSLNFRRHLSRLSVFSLTSLASSVCVNLDAVLLGLYADKSEVGFYFVGVTLARMVSTVVGSGAMVFLASNSFLSTQQQESGVKKNFDMGLHLALLTGFPLAIFLFGLREEIVLLVSGTGFAKSIPVLAWASWTIALKAVSNVIAIQYFQSIGKERWTLGAVALEAVFSLGCNLLLIPVMGSLGAAITTALTEAVLMILVLSAAWPAVWKAIVARKLYKILIASASLFATLLVLGQVPFGVVDGLLIKGIVSTVVCVVTLLFLKDEIVLKLVAAILSRPRLRGSR